MCFKIFYSNSGLRIYVYPCNGSSNKYEVDGDKISRSIMEVDVFKDEIFDCIIIATDVAKYYYCE